MAEYDPSDHKVDEVNKKLEKASPDERAAILRKEQAGQARKTILEPWGLDPDARVDASGRTLYPWEVDPAEQVLAVEVDETDEEREAREAQAEFDAAAEAAAPVLDEQGGVTAPGVGYEVDAGDTF